MLGLGGFLFTCQQFSRAKTFRRENNGRGEEQKGSSFLVLLSAFLHVKPCISRLCFHFSLDPMHKQLSCLFAQPSYGRGPVLILICGRSPKNASFFVVRLTSPLPPHTQHTHHTGNPLHHPQASKTMFGIFGRLNPFGGGGGDKACDIDAPPALATDSTGEMAIKTEDTDQVELPLYEEGMRLLVQLREVLRLDEKEAEELAAHGVEGKGTITAALLQTQAQRLKPVRKSAGGTARGRALHLREHGNNQENSGTSVGARHVAKTKAGRKTEAATAAEETETFMDTQQDDQIQGEPDEEQEFQNTQSSSKRTSPSLPQALACLEIKMISSPDLQSVKLRKTRRRSQEVETESQAGAAAPVATTKTLAKRSRVSKGAAGEGGGEGSHVKSAALQVQNNGAAPDYPPNHSFASMASPEPARRTRVSTRGSARRTSRGSLV